MWFRNKLWWHKFTIFFANGISRLIQEIHLMVERDESARGPKVPEKVARPRCNSTCASPAQAQPARKRTSSGVFQVDESEPEPKKSELTRTQSDESRSRPEAVPNGRRKTESESETENQKGIKKENIIGKFDTEAKSTCVTAFKESESWD